MSVVLPASFLEKMKFLLDYEYDNFMSSCILTTIGLRMICEDRCPVEFGKHVDGMINNELLAGWRLI